MTRYKDLVARNRAGNSADPEQEAIAYLEQSRWIHTKLPEYNVTKKSLAKEAWDRHTYDVVEDPYLGL